MQGLIEKFESPRPGKGVSILAMEGLRGFAVFLVFLVHFVSLGKPWMSSDPLQRAIADAVYYMGNIGVDLFFVLSGYLIYGSLMMKPQPFGRFLVRRVRRIYPTFLAVFFIYLFLFLLLPGENSIPEGSRAAGLYLLQNLLFLPGLFDIEPMISVAWSLSYEAFFYILTPILIASLALRRWSSFWRVLLFLAIAALAAVLALEHGGPIRLVVFLAGMLLFEAMHSQRFTAPSSFIGLAALVVALGVTPLRIEGETFGVAKTYIHAGGFFLLCLSCFRVPDSTIARVFSWAPMRYLGNMSYSYYLLHGLALQAAFLVLEFVLRPDGDLGPSFWLLMPPLFVLTLLPTAGLYLVVERPLSLRSRQNTKKPEEGLGST